MQVGLGSMVTLGNKLLRGPIGQQRLADLETLCLKCHHAEHGFTSNDHSNGKPRCGEKPHVRFGESCDPFSRNLVSTKGMRGKGRRDL
jgi:hypothetical protein